MAIWVIRLCSLDSSNILEVFPILLFSSISLHCSLKEKLSYLSLLVSGTLHSAGYIFLFLLCFSLLFFSQLLVRPPKTTILPICISFSWGWSWSLPPAQCHKPPSVILQTLYLSDIIPWIYFSFHCIIVRDLF